MAYIGDILDSATDADKCPVTAPKLDDDFEVDLQCQRPDHIVEENLPGTWHEYRSGQYRLRWNDNRATDASDTADA